MARNNPFTIVFGKEPSSYISTNSDIETITEEFLSDNPPTQVYAITGVRGSGKTVMLGAIKERIDQESDWISMRLLINNEETLLQNFASQLYERPEMKPVFIKAEIDLSKWGIGIKLKTNGPISSITTAIHRMLEVVKKEHKKVLIVIDEVTNCENMRNFISLFQAEVAEKMPIFLVMTGLPQNFYNLSKDSSMTFLKRCPRIIPKPLNFTLVKQQYKKIFETISEDEAIKMATYVGGYPYAYQVLGYLMWNNRDNCGSVDDILPLYDAMLAENAYSAIWEDICKSERDIEIIKAIVFDGLCMISDIKGKLGIGDNDFNQCKQRLIRKGVLKNTFKRAEITLPRFDEFVKESIGA